MTREDVVSSLFAVLFMHFRGNGHWMQISEKSECPSLLACVPSVPLCVDIFMDKSFAFVRTKICSLCLSHL